MGYSILHVDDSEDSLEFTREFLEMEGFTIITCAQSHTSLEILKQTDIDCLITDLHMPILEGQDLIALVRKKYPEIPIIVLSAYIESEEALLADGVYATLRKPASTDSIIRTIYAAIDSKGDGISLKFNELHLLSMRKTLYKTAITKALCESRGIKTKASNVLGISRPTLLRYLREFDISESTVHYK